jgi:hypothetical protein
MLADAGEGAGTIMIVTAAALAFGRWMTRLAKSPSTASFGAFNLAVLIRLQLAEPRGGFPPA